MSCPCDGLDNLRNVKKGIVFAVIQKLMDTKIINKLEKPIEGIETSKVAKGKVMKINLMTKTIVYIVTNYLIDQFKDNIIKMSEPIQKYTQKDGKFCFCMLQDLIVIVVLQGLSIMKHKRIKGKDLINNIASVYGTSFIYDNYAPKYLNFLDDIVPKKQDQSTVQEKTSTSITNQGGQVTTNLNQQTSTQKRYL